MRCLVNDAIPVGSRRLEPPAVQGVRKVCQRDDSMGKDVLADLETEVAEGVGSRWFWCSLNRPS